MSSLNQASRPGFLFQITGFAIPVSVVGFSAYEGISQRCSVHLTVAGLTQIKALDAVIGKEAVLTVVGHEAGGCDRHFQGIIRECRHSGSNGKYFLYELELVPSLWRLTLRKNCRIFQEMNVQDIVKLILEEDGITSERYRFALTDKDRKRGFCVQYRESDFDFISRLLEEEGIFYFFQHDKDKHVLVISDDKAVHHPIDGNGTIPFNSGGMLAEKECIESFTFSHCLRPGAFSHRNFSFKKPSLDLTAAKSGTNPAQFEIYDYPALHTTQQRGDQLAGIRMEEQLARRSQGRGQTSCCRLAPGCTFTLAEHDSDSLNMEYLVVDVMHSGVQPQSLEEMSMGGFSYGARFSVIPASIPFRPAITIRKPFIAGLQTAIVVGPPGEEIHTDEYGRIKVRFHWDREERNDGMNSCWLRINQPWSGSSWGMIALPRVGDEVLVAFLEGDPDRPIMVGNVNNADSPALYPLPANRTQTGLRTRSTPNGTHDNYNELRFEDQKGSEHVYLQGEKDCSILIKNDKGQIIGNSETLLVENDRNKTVKRNQSETIGIDKTIAVGADHKERIGANMSVSIGASKSETVGANKNETVGANSAESVGLAKELSIGGLYQVSVGGAMNETVAGAKTEEVGMVKAVVVGADMTEKVIGSRRVSVGTTFEMTAGESFQISCGKSLLRMDSDGSVFINGARLDFSASGIVKVSGEDIRLN